MFDNRLSILADHGDTEGRYDLVEGLVPAGFETSLHRHTRYTEHFFVLEGEITVWLEGRTAVLEAGESVLIPMGAAHAISVPGYGPARTLVVASPSGFARLISEVGIADGPQPSPDAFDRGLFGRLSAELGDEVLGPPKGPAPRRDG